MFQIFLYAFLTLLILFVLGFGLTQLIIPKKLRVYALWLSPWFSIIFIIITSIILGFFGLSIKYTVFLIIAILVLINLIILSKTKLRYIFAPKEDIIILFFIIINLVFNLSPLIIRDKFPTAISFGNNDVVNYVVASDDLVNHSFYKLLLTSISPYDKSHIVAGNLIRGGYRWGPPVLTAFFLHLFNLKAYQYVYILQAILFTLSVPLLYLLLKLIYRPTILGLILILAMMGFNANLLYMLYHNFFGQVLFWGLELFILFFSFAYFSSCREERNRFNKYELIIGATLAALYFSYHEAVTFFILPLLLFFLLRLILRKNITAYCFALVRIFFTSFLISSYSIFNAIVGGYLQSFAADQNLPIGWQLFRSDLPYANPFEMMGFYSIHSFKPLPVLLAIFLSILTITIIYLGFQKSKGKLLIICFLTLYVFFLILMGLIMHNFFAYNRVVTYTLPLFLMLFSIGIIRFYRKQKSLGIIMFLIIICLEIFSGIKLNERFIKERLSVDKSYISIKELYQLNINEPIYSEAFINNDLPPWKEIWLYHFLYEKTKFYPIEFQNKIPDNSLVLISKPTPWYKPAQVLLTNIVWENEYYKLGRICNEDSCLIKSIDKLNEIKIGKNNYEDSLLISGWGISEGDTRWANEKESTLRLITKQNYPKNLTISALTLKKPQEITVYLDDKLLGKISLDTEWKEYNLPINYKLFPSIHKIKFVYSNGYRPMNIIPNNLDNRTLYVNFREIKLE